MMKKKHSHCLPERVYEHVKSCNLKQTIKEYFYMKGGLMKCIQKSQF